MNILNKLRSWFSGQPKTKEPPAPPTKPKLCIIDDDHFVHTMLKQHFPEYNKVDWYRLPCNDEELQILKSCNVIIVDCQGIGNNLYIDGQQFLAKYYDRPSHQTVVFHSGLSPDWRFGAILQEKGMFYHTKGDDPAELIRLINEHQKGINNGKR